MIDLYVNDALTYVIDSTSCVTTLEIALLFYYFYCLFHIVSYHTTHPLQCFSKLKFRGVFVVWSRDRQTTCFFLYIKTPRTLNDFASRQRCKGVGRSLVHARQKNRLGGDGGGSEKQGNRRKIPRGC